MTRETPDRPRSFTLRLRRPYLRALTALALVGSLLRTPAIAACCNDFWSCAAAVATGGVSCAIEAFVATIKTMIASVQTLQATITKDVNDVVTAARQAVATAGSDLTKLAEAAQNDFNTALASAQQLNNTVQTQKLPANPSAQAAAVDAALKDALSRAKAEIENLKPNLTANADTVRRAAATALTQVQDQVQAAMNLVQTVLLAPLQNILSTLENLVQHPESLANPQAIVDSVILSVTAQMAQTMDAMTAMLIKNANATLEAAREPAQLALDQAARAKQINSAMQLAGGQRSQGAIDQLNSILPAQAVTGIAPVTGTMAGGSTVVGTPAGNPRSASSTLAGSTAGNRGVISIPKNLKLTADALAKIGAARPKGQALAAKWKTSLDRDWANLKKKQQAVLHPVLPAGADNSFKSHGDTLLAKLDKAQLESSRSTIIAEARKRFASDPQTLAKVEQLLNREIDRRQALLAKVPPAGPR